MTEAPVVLVNGLPGAGKTTLARNLSQRTGLPLFSKDAIKEAHADVLGSQPPPGWPQRRWNAALGAAAGETMWALLADAPEGAVLESCWPKDSRHFVVRGIQRANIQKPLEIWCDVPIEIARRRFEGRHPRHPIHGEPPTDAEWQHWRQTAEPLQISHTLRVDTNGPLDMDAIVAWINQRASATTSSTVSGRKDPIANVT